MSIYDQLLNLVNQKTLDAVLVFVLTDNIDPEPRKQQQLNNPGPDVLS